VREVELMRRRLATLLISARLRKQIGAVILNSGHNLLQRHLQHHLFDAQNVFEGVQSPREQVPVGRGRFFVCCNTVLMGCERRIDLRLHRQKLYT
jgi:hypothetical protein